MTLDQQLEQYGQSDMYPFHMPGHKRQLTAFPQAYGIDITEIDGFDNLHGSEGVLKEAQQRAADLYEAQKAWYLINGSTCGILAAVSAAIPKGRRVLVARNCHKAVYHAIYLRELQPVYLYPELTSQGLQGVIDPGKVEGLLEEDPEIAAVILTSPTYDGLVSDIAAIAAIAHRHQIPLIVDQAHGAHFGMSAEMPENAGKLGADLVIVSVHKTLPAFTQTALLLSYTDRVPQEKLDAFLDIYETSSPSYILMAGIDRCVCILREQKETLFAGLRRKLDGFYEQTAALQCLKVVNRQEMLREAVDFDDSKILMLTDRAGISGSDLAEYLRRDYHIELEMASGNYGLALATVMDREEGFCRLAEALKDLDGRLQSEGKDGHEPFDPAQIYLPTRRRMEIHEALELPAKAYPLAEAVGKPTAVYLYLYPPGIPILVPGEVLTAELKEAVEKALAAGMEVHGLMQSGKEDETWDIYTV